MARQRLLCESTADDLLRSVSRFLSEGATLHGEVYATSVRNRNGEGITTHYWALIDLKTEDPKSGPGSKV